MTILHFVNDDGITALSESCPNLKLLCLHGASRITSIGAEALFTRCTKLQYLDLSYCTKVLQALRVLPESLKEISLCGVMIQDEELFVSSVTRLQNLTLARFCGVPALSDDSLTKILSKIGGNIVDLDLSGSVMSSLTDDGLSAITKYCCNLKALALSLLPDITGGSLVKMFRDTSRAEAFVCLLLSCKKLIPEVVDMIAMNCCNLETLNIAGLPFVDDLLLAQIAENCPKLNHVNLKGCRNVGDAGIMSLARQCELRVAILSGLHLLTDQAMFTLANTCPYLEEIHLNGCAMVSQASVAYLKDQCIPRVWSTHKTPNASGDQVVARNLDTGHFGLVP